MEAIQLVYLALQLGELPAQSFDMGQQLGPFRCQADAGAAAGQEGQVPLLLQVVYHPADARLGVVQRFRRPGEAAVLHCLQEGQVFQQVGVHGVLFLSGFRMEWMRNSRFSHAPLYDKLIPDILQANREGFP